MCLVRASDTWVMFPKSEGFSVSQANKTIIVGFEERFYLAASKVNPWMWIVIWLAEGYVMCAHQLRMIVYQQISNLFVWIDNFLEN